MDDEAGTWPARQAVAGLGWWDCGDGLQCAKLSVPVDWARPQGARTVVDLARMPAQDPLRRLGALVVNTGAASVVQAVRAQPDTVGELARWFDVVLVEARGAGDRGSTAMVRCVPERPSPDRLPYAFARDAWRAVARDNAAYDRGCREAMGAAYPGLTSWQVAHDLDAVRAALGEPRLRYFGNGYGSVYGQAYLELFPGRVDRMYLEGLPDHTETSLERRLLVRARAQERQLGYFRSWCRTRPGCPLGHADAISVFDGLVRRAPLPASGGDVVSGREIAAAVSAGLVPGRWPELARALSRARAGDAGSLAAMAPATDPSQYGAVPHPESPPGRTVARVERGAVQAAPQAAVGPSEGVLGLGATGRGNRAGGSQVGGGDLGSVDGVRWCRDFGLGGLGYRRYSRVQGRLRKVAPRVGWLSARAEVVRCLGVARDGRWRPHAVPARLGKASVLIGVGRLDNVTPAPGAAGRLPGARVLWHGDGYGAYLAQGVARLRAACLRTKVHDYLVNGRLPEPGTFCEGELTAGAAP